MPYHLGVSEHADCLAVFDYVRDDNDFRMRARFFLAGLRERCRVEIAQTLPERDEVESSLSSCPRITIDQIFEPCTAKRR